MVGEKYKYGHVFTSNMESFQSFSADTNCCTSHYFLLLGVLSTLGLISSTVLRFSLYSTTLSLVVRNWVNNKYKLYGFFWVIPQRLNCICRRFGTLCLFHLDRQVGVKKRQHTKFRRRGITQKKAYNIQNKSKF